MEGRLDRSETLLVASEAVLSTTLGDTVVLLDPVGGAYYSLNETGARIWELLREPNSVDGLCRQLQEEYAVEPAVCEHDVGRVVSELVSRGMVRAGP